MATASAKVLIVDDDSATLRVLDLAFRKKGYDVRQAPSGPAGLQVLGREKVGVIIADIIMPEMDGFEFFRRVRGQADLGTIPFIFLTGDRTSKSKVRGFEMGVDDYITKPCVLSELFAKVESILKKATAASSATAGEWDLSGKLSAMPIPELIQILEMSKKTGRLLISTDKLGSAEIFFDAGNICHAHVLDLDVQGEEAVYILFAVTEGEFHFRADETTDKRTVNKHCAALLLEGLRQKDETQALLARREKAAAQPAGIPQPPEEPPRRQATTIQTRRPAQPKAAPPGGGAATETRPPTRKKRIAGGPPPRRRR